MDGRASLAMTQCSCHDKRGQNPFIFSLLVLTASFSLVNRLYAQESLVGLWVAPDENAPGVTSVVELYLRDAKPNGRIVLTRNAEGQEIHPVCEKCSGPLQGAPIKGMTFIFGLNPQQGNWVGGKVMDLRPGLTQGMQASCDISLVNGRAHVLGYFMSRTWGKSSVWSRL
jgi:hypothetical protein